MELGLGQCTQWRLAIRIQSGRGRTSGPRTANLQRSVTMPENLRLNAILAETLGDEVGHTASMPAMIYLSLNNVGNDLITLPLIRNVVFKPFC